MNSRKDRLAAIKQKSDELNSLADAATAELAEVEEQLVESGVGVEVWDGVIFSESSVYSEQVGYADVSTMSTVHEYRIGFAKIDGKWGFVINEYEQIDEECERQYDLLKDGRYFLRSAPRDIRINALPHIDELIESIEKELESKIMKLSK